MITAWPEPNTDAASGATTPTDDLQSAASSWCDAAPRRPVQISGDLQISEAASDRSTHRAAVRHRRPLQVLPAHCLRARRQNDPLLPPVAQQEHPAQAPGPAPAGSRPNPAATRRVEEVHLYDDVASERRTAPRTTSGVLRRGRRSNPGRAAALRRAKVASPRRPGDGEDGARNTVRGVHPWYPSAVGSVSCGPDRSLTRSSVVFVLVMQARPGGSWIPRQRHGGGEGRRPRPVESLEWAEHSAGSSAEAAGNAIAASLADSPPMLWSGQASVDRRGRRLVLYLVAAASAGFTGQGNGQRAATLRRMRGDQSHQ